MRHLEDEDLDAISVILNALILTEIHDLKEAIMSELDDAVTRITTDIANAVGQLQTAIAEVASTGADVTKLNDAAASLEAALTPAEPAPVAETPVVGEPVTQPDGTVA